jgi:hypothetical protein
MMPQDFPEQVFSSQEKNRHSPEQRDEPIDCFEHYRLLREAQ